MYQTFPNLTQMSLTGKYNMTEILIKPTTHARKCLCHNFSLLSCGLGSDTQSQEKAATFNFDYLVIVIA